MTQVNDTIIKMMRFLGWGLVAVILIAPAIAMQVGAEGVDWRVNDFVVMGALLGGVGLAFELAVRKTKSLPYLFGAAAALVTTLLTIWFNLAVGIIGNENDPINLIFFAVILLAAIGALVVKFRAAGMATVMTVAGIAQAATLIVTIPRGDASVAYLFILLSVLGWLFAGECFRLAAKA